MFRFRNREFAAVLVVLGMTVLGCQKKTEQVTAKNSQFEVDESDGSTAAKTNAAPTPNEKGAAEPNPATPKAGGATPSGPAATNPNIPSPVGGAAKPTGVGAPGGTEKPIAAAPDIPPPAKSGVAPPPAAKGGGPSRGPSPPAAGAGAPPEALAPIVMENYDPPKKGNPKQLLEHIAKLSRAQPKGRTRDEQMRDLQEIQRARIISAELLLASTTSSNSEKLIGVEVKLESMHLLNQLGVPEVMPHLRQFAAALRNHEVAEIANLGRLIYFGIRVGDLSNPQTADVNWVMKELETILAAEKKTPQALSFTREASKQLYQMGHETEAIAASDAVIKAFEKHPDPQVTTLVAVFREEMVLIRNKLAEKLEAAVTNKDGAFATLIATVKQLAARKGTGGTTLDALVQCGQYLEFSQHYDESKKVYAEVEAGLKDQPDAKLVEAGKRSIENGRKRMGMVGQPMVVEGVTLGGGPFDWGKYRGKVVLVMYWATWSGPCIRELPVIMASHQRYKEKGFDVVGINLDEDHRQLDGFLRAQKLPWPSVLAADPGARGLERDPRATKNGVDGVPFVALVGRDGKVIDIHLNGPQLDRRLEQLFAAEAAAKKQGGE